MKTLSPAFLPDELIFEVLSFLPVRSLVRFRCVSKSWKTLISDSTFVKLHLHNSRSQTRNSSLLTIITKNTICIPGYHVEHKEEFSIVRHPIHRVFQNHSFAVVSEDGDSLILQSNLESQTILLYDRRHNRAKRTEIIASTTISDIASTTIADFRNSNYVYQDFAKDYVESLVPIF